MWIKSKEFKKILGLSNQAVYERRKKGQLKFKKVNEVYFYWLEENITSGMIESRKDLNKLIKLVVENKVKNYYYKNQKN